MAQTGQVPKQGLGQDLPSLPWAGFLPRDWYAAGKRQIKSFPTYAGQGGAHKFAEELVRELANNSHAVMLFSFLFAYLP